MIVFMEMTELYRKTFSWLAGPGLYILLVSLGAVLCSRLLRYAISRLGRHFAYTTEDASDREKRIRALSGFLTAAGTVAIYILAAVSILDRLGVRTGSILASLGIAGIAVGFGAQTLVRDLIAGIFMLAEGQLSVGDTVKLHTSSGPVQGTVEKISVRTTTVRGAEGEAQIVPNGEIKLVANYSKEWAKAVVDLVASPEAASQVGEVLAEAAMQLYEEPDWQPYFLSRPELLGVEEIQLDSVRLRLVAKVAPSKKAVVARELRRRALEELASRGLVASAPES